ncbi:MAG TPA: DnaJ domain-containing protein [Bryobacteraceae bacterium]|jgi:DnaJ-class molecular chaperone|nr:DnaJ domain-containing protein [Bryobacteraceae bacterium]
MAIKNYYAILGVSRTETPSGIRAAYRDAVRRTHPDYAGPRRAADFQEVVEAHSVLSNAERRRQYDEDLDRSEWDQSWPGLVHRFGRDWEPPSIFANTHAVHPSFDALAERLLRNFTGLGVPKAERPQALTIEVILTPEEAARRGVVSVGVPVHEVCPACGGAGRDWFFLCPHCGGEGMRSRTQPVEVRIPQALRLGLTPEVSLEMFGINNLFLRLRLRVSDG